MARQLRIEYPGALYHVASRGNDKKDIFRSIKDREKFLAYLLSAWERHGAIFHAWRLMSNHFHLMIETPEGNLSRMKMVPSPEEYQWSSCRRYLEGTEPSWLSTSFALGYRW